MIPFSVAMEIAAASLLGKLAQSLVIKHTAGRCVQRDVVHVGGKDFDFGIALTTPHLLINQDGDRVSFLTGGTAGDPDADRALIAAF